MAIVRNRAEHILDLTGGNWIAPAEEKNIDTSPDHEQDLLAQGVLVLVGPETAPAQPATHWPPAYHPYDDNYAGHTWDRFIKSDNEDLSEMDDQLLGLTDRLEQLFIAPLRLDQVPLPAASVNMNGQRLVGLGSPTAAADAATKSYVDAVSQGLDVKAAVRASTTAPITLSGTQTIDGVAVIAGDRVLVKNQGTPTENGIYEVAAGAWTRTTDADTSAELHTGIFTFVQEGTVNASTGWVVSTTGLISIGSTAIVFTQFSGTGQITAGGGLVKSGAVLDVVAGPGIQVDADAVRIAPDAGRVAASDGLVTKAKAGAIVDGDFTATPVNGLIGVNTSSNELVYRSGGQWYGLQTSVVNAKHEGADPTFVADSTTALRNAWTKYLAGSYSAFVIPPGNYKIDPGTTTPMFEATGKKGIRVEASGATLNDVHDYSAGGIGHLFKFFGCDDTYINLNVVSTINPAAPYDNGDRGLRVVTCQASGTYGGQGMDLIGRHEGCLWSFSAVKLGADVDSMKFRNVRIKIQTYNTFYPLSFQFSGDNVYAEADIERCGRAYFPYGIKNHEIHINVKNQRLQSVIGGGGVVSLDSPYCGCENIELHYRDRDSDTGTLYGSSGQGVVLLWRWDAGNPGAVTHKNINFYMDTKANLGSGFWSVLTGVQFRKQIATTSADDTTPRGHTLDGCRIFGTMDGDFGGAAAVIDNFNNTVVVGDPHLNCVCEARLSGLVNPNFPPGWIRRFSGTGSPETVVAAPPGSTFNRTDGDQGTTLYVKRTGSAKTGWTEAGAAKLKAGTIADGDFSVTPPDGTLGVNTTEKQIAYRAGGTWYQRTSPAPAATYPLGTDALDNIAIGTTWPALTPGVVGSGQTFGCQRNTVLGSLAGGSMVTDYGEVAIGYNALGVITNGRDNIAIGDSAMGLATGGDRNIAIGAGALLNATGINFYTTNTTTVNGAGQTISTTPSTLTVVSTAGFASSGKVRVGTVLVSYTGLTGTTFTGATIPSGSFTPANGVDVGVAAGSFNIAIGETAGAAITTGYANVFVGPSAGKGAITSDHCTYVGESAGQFLQGGSGIVVVGADSLNNATSNAVSQCVAVGTGCLQSASVVTSDIVAVGHGVLTALTIGTRNTSVGSQSGRAVTTGGSNTMFGYAAGFNLTTGSFNVLIGPDAGQTAATTTSKNTCVGSLAGHTGSTVQNNMTLLGYGTIGTGDGAVAIGIDSAGTSATAAANEFVLGTATHKVKILNNATGSGSAALGANCPATTATAPYTWFRMLSSDGSTVYVPAWK